MGGQLRGGWIMEQDGSLGNGQAGLEGLVVTSRSLGPGHQGGNEFER